MSAPMTSDVDLLAQEIRRVDGENKLGAGALAEALSPFIAAWNRRTAPVGGRDAMVRKIAQAMADGKDCGGYDTLLDMYAHAALKVIEDSRYRPTAPSREDVARAVEALRPFVEALKRVDRGGPDNACFIGSQLTLGDLRDAEAAILALLGQTGDGWLPIESAPKDGSYFTAFWPHIEHTFSDHQGQYRTRWTGWGGGCWEADSLGRPVEQPTHWQPLPAPPAKEGR